MFYVVALDEYGAFTDLMVVVGVGNATYNALEVEDVDFYSDEFVSVTYDVVSMFSGLDPDATTYEPEETTVDYLDEYIASRRKLLDVRKLQT